MTPASEVPPQIARLVRDMAAAPLEDIQRETRLSEDHIRAILAPPLGSRDADGFDALSDAADTAEIISSLKSLENQGIGASAVSRPP
jgi:hypothetical protein